MGIKKFKKQIKKVVACFAVVFTLVLGNINSFYAGTITVSDNDFTIVIQTGTPFSVVLPAQPTSVSGQSFSEFDFPFFTGIYITNNVSSKTRMLNHFIIGFSLNFNGAGYFTTYPSGAQFQHVIHTTSYLSDYLFVSVNAVQSTTSVVSVLYDIWFIPQGNGMPAGRHYANCGISDVGSLTYSSTSATAALSSVPSSLPTNSSFFSYALAHYDENTSILTAINSSLSDLNTKVSLTNSELSELISLTTATNNILTSINNGIANQTNTLVNKLDTESAEIQQAISDLETTLVSSLNVINNQLILINNNISKLDSDMVEYFNYFIKSFSGFYYSGNPPQVQMIIQKVRENWASIIAKGLDEVAPDTSELDSKQESAGQSLAQIGSSDIISNIGNTSSMDSGFSQGTDFFTSWSTKILTYNNLLQEVYNALGPLTYVIIITLVVGMTGFIYRVRNSFTRGSSGGGEKSINLPKKLR